MKRKTALGISKISFHVTFVLFALAVTASPMLLDYAGIINTTFKIQTSTGSGSDGNVYFDTEFKTMDEVKQASKNIIDETLKEGAVLLKNDNDALPLAKEDTVNLYGAASYHSVVTGMGSSSFKVNGDQDPFADIVTLEQGLTSAGLSVNKNLNEWYKNNGLSYLNSTNGHFIGYEDQEVQLVVEDAPWSALPSDKENDAKAGIMVLARNSGEAIDLYMDTTMDDGQTRTIVSRDHNGDPNNSVGDALALTDNEKDVLQNMKRMKDEGKLDKIIVIMNCASPFQSAFVDQEE